MTQISPPDVRLHGYPVSNWFNCARAAMIEKGLGASFEPCRASRDEDFLALSAMGKIPWLETAAGGIAETVAILDYLEELQPEPPLLPADPFARAKVRQMINIAQLYVEAPLRSLYPGVFMGASNSDEKRADAEATLARSIPALLRLAAFGPWLAGPALSQADLVLFYALELGDRVMLHEFGRSLSSAHAELERWQSSMRTRASTQVVLADFHPAFLTYLADRHAAWQEPDARISKNA